MGVTCQVVSASGVATVCQEARCPNQSECWAHKTATFMILGDRCTRRCRFCAVTSARPELPATDEPDRLAEAVAELGLKHAVITAVARDDLADEGAGHFALCIQSLRVRVPAVTIEVLPADFHARRDCIKMVIDANPDVYNHNTETVERISPVVRPQADYRRSLEALRLVKELHNDMMTKSGLMVGLGETVDEIHQTLADLRDVGCDIVTIGQYLQPSPKQTPIVKFYTPQEFEELGAVARKMGFAGVASAPFVRSSYNAIDIYERIRQRRKTE